MKKVGKPTTTKNPNIQTTGVPEGEVREKEAKRLFKEVWLRTSQTWQEI